MANKKNKVNFLCSACGDDFPKWHGQCPSCKEWGTLSEFKVLGNKNIKRSKLDYRDYKPLNDILDSDPGERITTNITEADRVLGGGPFTWVTIIVRRESRRREIYISFTYMFWG